MLLCQPALYMFALRSLSITLAKSRILDNEVQIDTSIHNISARLAVQNCTAAYFFLMTTTLPLLPTVTCTSSSTKMKSLKPFALFGKFICATPSWPCTIKLL